MMVTIKNMTATDITAFTPWFSAHVAKNNDKNFMVRAWLQEFLTMSYR